MAGYQEGSGEVKFLQGGTEDIEAVSLRLRIGCYSRRVMRVIPIYELIGWRDALGVLWCILPWCWFWQGRLGSFPLHLRLPIVIPMVTGYGHDVACVACRVHYRALYATRTCIQPPTRSNYRV